MLPVVDVQATNTQVDAFLQALMQAGFTGDTASDYANRLTMATDNSVYHQLPQAVLFPRNKEDLCLIGRIGQQAAYQSLVFSARGGGTGTNGQSLTLGIVVDMSRYMQTILEINPQEGWVRVQAGVIKDQLNEALRPYGFFFSPDLSTSNRATIGGMINTDASGQGSLRYGKTSDHVMSLTAVLIDGSVMETEKRTYEQMNRCNTQDSIAQIVTKTATICKDNRAKVLATFPKLNRFLTGYDLQHAYDEPTDTHDMARILCGSEGTLAFIAEAQLHITPIPKARTLIAITYDDFDAALRNASMLLEAQALSVETLDSHVLQLAKQDVIWHQVSPLFNDQATTTPWQGLNMVEFASTSIEENNALVQALCARLDDAISAASDGIIGYSLCDKKSDIDAIYAMRKKAVGLLGGKSGARKPIPFAEDTCVPPEQLADFITEFRALLDHHHLEYGMFGHVDAGVLHVRPALDLCTLEDEQRLHQLSDKVVALVAKYGGLMWGEHGKGFRSEYGPAFFGDHLFTQLRHIKTLFDPHNRMNPGKICTPLASKDTLVSIKATKRGTLDRDVPQHWRDDFAPIFACNGNGLCFDYQPNSPMCPSMKVSQDRVQSPKGRAVLIREWLRLLAQQNVDITQLEAQLQKKSPGLLATVRRCFKPQDASDFNHQVMRAMQGCLACKCCASQCPSRVDIPNFRARFLQLYHSRYRRPFGDYCIAYLEKCLPIIGRWPKVFNTLLRAPLIKRMTASFTGLCDTPLFSVPSLTQRLQKHAQWTFDLAALQKLTPTQRQSYVLLVQDPFTSFYEAQVVYDMALLAEKLGKKPVILPLQENGKALQVKGFLRDFRKVATKSAAFFNALVPLGIPMVGLDAASVLCYRDEYRKTLTHQRGDFQVLTLQEWMRQLPRLPLAKSSASQTWYLLSHCTEKTALPDSENQWVDIFARVNLHVVPVAVGCCGMAGIYGHEKRHISDSRRLYAMSWEAQLEKLDTTHCMATGYSCRSQVARFSRLALKHPVQVLLHALA